MLFVNAEVQEIHGISYKNFIHVLWLKQISLATYMLIEINSSKITLLNNRNAFRCLLW